MPAEALKTVGQYVAEARTLLQDTVNVPVSGYRYSDADLVNALNIGLQEAYRLRADLFLSIVSFTVPGYATSDFALTVPIQMGYRQAFVYYMVGRMQMRDQEDTEDQRAAALLQKFVQQLLITTS